MTSPLLIPASPALDEGWFERLTNLAGITLEIYTILGPSEARLEKARRAFFDRGENPDLRPTGLDYDALAVHRHKLEDLAADIATTEPSETVRRAYELRIAELLTNLDLLVAAGRGDTAAFERANVSIYGRPDPALSSGQEFTPASEIFDKMAHLHHGPHGFFIRLFHGADLPVAGSIVDEIQGDPLIHQILTNVGATDYRLVNSPDGYWGMQYGAHAVTRPAKYHLTREEFLGIASHEIGSHLLERLNGERQPLRLLAFGLDHYERGNEGRALLREQVAYATWQDFADTPRWRETLLRHRSIVLATGADGHAPRSFAEVFSLIRPACPSDDFAWRLIARSLKGTDGHGGAYLKDIVYLEGNLACWRTAATDPQAIMLGDHGKFDINSLAHRAILDELHPASPPSS